MIDRPRQSMGGCLPSAAQPRSPRFCRHNPQSQAAFQGSINISLLCTTILRHWREPFLFNTRQVSMFPRCCCRVLREEPRRRLAQCLPLNHSEAIFSSTLILASGSFSEPATHLMKDGKGLGATLGPNSDLPHRCREGCNFSFTDAWGVVVRHISINVLLNIHDAVFWDVGGDFLRFRKRADPLVSFFFFKKTSIVCWRNRHSSGKSPVAYSIVRMSRPRNKHLLCPAPAKETMASRCSCRSPVGPGALMGANMTCGSDATPVLLRPCSLKTPALYLTPPQATCVASAHSAVVGMSASARAPPDQGCSPVSPTVSRAKSQAFSRAVRPSAAASHVFVKRTRVLLPQETEQ